MRPQHATLFTLSRRYTSNISRCAVDRRCGCNSPLGLNCRQIHEAKYLPSQQLLSLKNRLDAASESDSPDRKIHRLKQRPKIRLRHRLLGRS